MPTIQTTATEIGQVSINPQGAWNSGTTYHRLDVVTYNGSSYIGLKDSTNKVPTNTTYWQLIAQKGDTYEVTEEDLQRIATQIEQDASSIFNQNVEAKTNSFNQNASQKVSDFNSNATSKTTDFNSNATSKTTDFNNNATSKTTAFNNNATEKTTAFDGNYNDKLGLFNGNATDKTTAFDNNASSKATDFNNNATSKTTDFNDNASSKTNTFNANAQDKVDYYNTNADSLIALSGGVLEQIPTAEVNNTVISVDDSAGEIPPKDIAILGNTSQATDVLTYTCIGTELGDYYFVYDNTNYQFTMPAISAGSVLAFNTTSLKLFLGDTEIATTTASTGTLIILNATPNPNYPQDIKVVTGDVEVTFLYGKNLVNIPAKASTNVYGIITKYFNNKIIFNGTATSSSKTIVGSDTLSDAALRIAKLKAGSYTFGLKVLGGTIDNGGHATALYFRNKNYAIIAQRSLNSTTITENNLYTWNISLPEDTDIYVQIFENVAPQTYNNIELQFSIKSGQNQVLDFDSLYQPSQTITLNLGSIELAKIGDYQDKIYKNKTDNKWYVHKEIGKFIFNGNQTFVASQREGVFVGNRFRYSGLGGVILRPSSNNIIAKILSTFLPTNSANHNYGGGESISCDNNGQIYWYSPALAGYDADQMNDWFETNNQILYYALATATDTEITDSALLSKLEELANSNTYKPITNIYTSTDNEEPNIYMVYRKDLTKMFSDLSNAILSLGNNT